MLRHRCLFWPFSYLAYVDQFCLVSAFRRDYRLSKCTFWWKSSLCYYYISKVCFSLVQVSHETTFKLMLYFLLDEFRGCPLMNSIHDVVIFHQLSGERGKILLVILFRPQWSLDFHLVVMAALLKWSFGHDPNAISTSRKTRWENRPPLPVFSRSLV